MTARYMYIPLFILVILLGSSCENELPFNLAANPPKLIMNALINADSTNNVLYLNLTGPNTIDHVSDATVEVRINDRLVESPQAIPQSSSGNLTDNQKRFLITSKFNPGDKVRIDARTGDGVHHAWAEVIVPPAPLPIEKIDTITARVNEFDNFYTTRMRYRITFADRPGNDTHYYRIAIDQRATLYAYIPYFEPVDTIMYLQNLNMISREDMVLTDGNPSIGDNGNGLSEQADNIHGVFDNNRFKGQSYTMTVYGMQMPWSGSYPYCVEKRLVVDTYVRLMSINETDYRYFKALNIIDSDVYDETLMEPLTFASNVHGGVGIISINTETTVKIRILDQQYENDES